MDSVKSFVQRFNCPAIVFEALGYILVGVGLICILLSLFGFFGTTFIGSIGIALVALIATVVVPQPFFAAAKVVEAAEKYLEQ